LQQNRNEMNFIDFKSTMQELVCFNLNQIYAFLPNFDSNAVFFSFFVIIIKYYNYLCRYKIKKSHYKMNVRSLTYFSFLRLININLLVNPVNLLERERERENLTI
jgi:hypothetical protein